MLSDVALKCNIEPTLIWAVLFQQLADHACGLAYAWLYAWPLQGATQTQQTIYTSPYSTRPDPFFDQGPYNGSNSQGQWTCNRNCFWFDFFGNQDVGPSAAVSYDQIKDNRDLWIAYVGVNNGLFQWTSDGNANMFPDEVADLLNNDVDPDDDCGAPVACGSGRRRMAPAFATLPLENVCGRV